MPKSEYNDLIFCSIYFNPVDFVMVSVTTTVKNPAQHSVPGVYPYPGYIPYRGFICRILMNIIIWILGTYPVPKLAVPAKLLSFVVH